MKLMVECSIYLCLAVWFAISIVAQFSDQVGDWFPRTASLGLIPLWTFFAPRPGMHDTHLLYRDRLRNGKIGSLSCVPSTEKRRWYHAIWNPGKYRNKVVADLNDSLMQYLARVAMQDRDIRVVVLSNPYLILANLVMQMPCPEEAEARQFILARDKNFGSDPGGRELVFMSSFHPLTENRAEAVQ